LAKVRFLHKNIAFGSWNAQASLLKANGGTGFVAGMVAGLTAESEFGLANGNTIPAFGIIQDNDWEVVGGYASGAGAIPAGTQGSMKVTVLYGSGTVLFVKPEATDTFADFATDAAATFTLNKKVYASVTGKLSTVASTDAYVIAYVIQVPTTANGFEVGLKLLV
jgi:hypothetical protein